MRVKAVRKLPGLNKTRLTHGDHDLLELQVGTYVDDALVAELDRLLKGFWSAETYRRRLHTYKQAADILHISSKYLQRRVSARQVPFTRVGAYVRFTGADIDEIRQFMHRANVSHAEVADAEDGRDRRYKPIRAQDDNESDNGPDSGQSRKPDHAELN